MRGGGQHRLDGSFKGAIRHFSRPPEGAVLEEARSSDVSMLAYGMMLKLSLWFLLGWGGWTEKNKEHHQSVVHTPFLSHGA